MPQHVIAIDQGTTSTRAIVFDASAQPVATALREHAQLFPRAGRVEHDPIEIWANTQEVVDEALRSAGLAAATTGLLLATYFSASKIAWILDNVEGAREAAAAGDLLFGTPDTWLVWNLAGGVDGGIHVTDVTNASRTLLMDLRTLDWAPELLEVWDIPRAMLPEIRSSSEVVGEVRRPAALAGVPIAGILGDQQAAAFGQTAFEAGESKNTYGTGNFLLVNTGADIVRSKAGLLTTVAYRLGNDAPRYAVEGSIAVAGSLVQWLRDNLGTIRTSAEVEELAASVADNGGAYFVPAFSGLFAPYWRPEARGALVGLTCYVTKGHLARAVLESTAFQSRDVIEAVVADAG